MKWRIVQIIRIGGREPEAPSDGRTRLRGDPSRGLPTKEGGGECGTWDWGRYIFARESGVILAFS